MTNKLVVIINSLKVPKIKKILLHEIKFLVPHYSCLQNPWLGGYHPQIPVLSVLNWICWTPPPSREQNSWVRHWIRPRVLGTLIYEEVRLEIGEDWLEPVLNIHTRLSPLSPRFCYLPPPHFNSVAKRRLFLGMKKYWRGICPPSQATLMTLCNWMEILTAKQLA